MNSVEKIIKGIKPSKMKKEQLAAFIFNHNEELTEFIVRKGHVHKFRDTKEKLFKIFADKKTLKGIKLVIKRGKKEPEYALPIEFVSLIGAYLEWANRQSDEMKAELEDINNEYFSIIEELLEKKAKKIAKKTDMDKNLIKELLVICPSDKYITMDKSGRSFIFTVQRVMRKLYILAKSTDNVVKEDDDIIKSVYNITYNDIKSLKKVIGEIFGKKRMSLVAVGILLEKKEFIRDYSATQTFMWNRVADVALDIIESTGKKDKKEAVSILQQYCTFRAADNAAGKDSARHINIMSLPCENYPYTYKAAQKLADNHAKFTQYL